MKVQVKIVNAFPRGQMGGNPAGIVLDFKGALSQYVRQKIASEVGLSETVFVSSPKDPHADYRLEFFTPNRQIPHCGHATIATFSYLVEQGEKRSDLTKETIDTPRKILIRDGKVFMQQLAPKYEKISMDNKKIMGMLSLTESKIAESHSPLIVSTANRFLLIPIDSLQSLVAIKPDLNAIRAFSETHDLIGFYPFVIQQSREVFAYSRMFAPRYGITEESATGMAAGPLGCYLYDSAGYKQQSFVIAQGEHMPEPSPSRIEVMLEVEDKKIKSLMVGGGGRFVETIELEVQQALDSVVVNRINDPQCGESGREKQQCYSPKGCV